MLPGVHLDRFGHSLALWDAVFLLGVLLGWLVFRIQVRSGDGLSAPSLRFGLVVYLSALSAQLFAYAFDANTSLAPPLGTTAAAYYLNPVAGPKTLYGVIVAMPVSVWLATRLSRLPLGRALDLWTRPMLVVLATTRVGCLLEGCCFGARSDLLGVAFPAGSPVYWQQRAAGLVPDGAAWSLPVVPTQGIEALILLMLAVLCGAEAGRGRLARGGGVFVVATAVYSVFRFPIEIVRADAERGLYGGLATSQWIALAVLGASVSWALRGKPRTGVGGSLRVDAGAAGESVARAGR